MTDNQRPKSPGQTAGELKNLLQDYAVQEVKDPLVALGKWVAYGFAGAVLVCIGVAYLAFGVLRLLQAEVGAFDDGLTFLNYWFAALVLLVAIALAVWGAMRTFDDERRD
jgi:fumarate reductase subunit D